MHGMEKLKYSVAKHIHNNMAIFVLKNKQRKLINARNRLKILTLLSHNRISSLSLCTSVVTKHQRPKQHEGLKTSGFLSAHVTRTHTINGLPLAHGRTVAKEVLSDSLL